VSSEKVPGSAISHQPSAISHQPSAISHQPSAISHQPSAISHQPSAISKPRLLAIYDRRFTTYRSVIDHRQEDVGVGMVDRAGRAAF
jgi:hypothetical protein